ncbi:glycosyl hydrolase 115 family protein, partial [Escherichia coli]|uniref:glycosyl hydrolase 115 family protein n=5 Tax=Pseudomonadota TaxID=1224 RepID=UPI001954D6A0
LKQAWDPEAMTPEALAAYPAAWAGAQFGTAQGKAIGVLLTRYAQLAARRKPELIDAGSFALGPGADGGEFGAMVAEWDALETAMLKAR